MQKKSHTFLHALKLWLIWMLLCELSLAGFGWIWLTLEQSGSGDAHSYYFGLLCFPPLGSPIVGLIQSLAFIHRIKHSYMWILPTALGYTLAWIVFWFIISLLWSSESFIIGIGIVFLAGSISGMVIGWLQYGVLWGKVYGAILWLEASILGWACAACAAYVLSQTSLGTVGALVGLLPMGMITGIAYAYLFSQPVQKRLV